MQLDPIQIAQSLATRLRSQAERNYSLAIARCRYEAYVRGLSLRLTQGGDVAVIADGRREVWANARRTGAVWEAICYFEYIHEGVRAPVVEGVPVVDLSKPGEHVLARSGKRFRFTAMPESEAMNDLYVEVGRLKAGDVAIDGGAYCGGSTVAMSQAVGPLGKVVAFEPDPENFAALEQNVARHGLPNVVSYQEGLWSSTGELEFMAGGGMLSTLVLPGIKPHMPTAKVRVRSLEQVINDERLQKLQFVKLDIEGAEPEVLESSRAVLREFRPRVVVEAVLENRRLNTQRLLKLLHEEDYDCRVVMEVWDATWQVICATPRQPS
jgi:FkbM family methyltransferase